MQFLKRIFALAAAFVLTACAGYHPGPARSDALFAQMQQRFATTELVEITAAIATYNMVARFLVALGVSPEE